MINFESDLVNPIDLPYGTPDQLDEWLLDQAWGDWLELMFDPDL